MQPQNIAETLFKKGRCTNQGIRVSMLQWLRLLSVLRQCLCCCLLLLPLWESVIVLCMFRCRLLYVHSSFAIILMGKLVALLSLTSWCLVIVVWLFHGVSWVCLQFVIVLFPDHTHLLFFITFPLNINFSVLV